MIKMVQFKKELAELLARYKAELLIDAGIFGVDTTFKIKLPDMTVEKVYTKKDITLDKNTVLLLPPFIPKDSQQQITAHPRYNYLEVPGCGYNCEYPTYKIIDSCSTNYDKIVASCTDESDAAQLVHKLNGGE